jgi:hypothetical protein
LFVVEKYYYAVSIEGRISRVAKSKNAQATRRAPAVKTRKRFADEVLAIFHQSKGLRLRAGNGDHRFIGIWFVVVEDRVLVRSWSVKESGWYRTFLKEPRGTVQIAGLEIPVCAVRTRNERLRDAVDRAYLAKYNTAGALKYAKDLARAKSRATTTELLPA